MINFQLQKQLQELKDSFRLQISKGFEPKKQKGRMHIIFVLAERLYAWPADELSQIIIGKKIIPLPMDNKKFYGMINHYNEVLPVINLHTQLQIPSVPLGSEGLLNTLMITSGRKEEIAFLVDELYSILSIEPQTIKPKPSSLDLSIAQKIVGEIYYDEKWITILDSFSFI